MNATGSKARIARRKAPNRYERCKISPHFVVIARGKLAGGSVKIHSVWDDLTSYVSKRKRVRAFTLTPEQIEEYKRTALFISSLRTRPEVEAHKCAEDWLRWLLDSMGWNRPEHWTYLSPRVRMHTQRFRRWSIRAESRKRRAMALLLPSLYKLWTGETDGRNKIVRYVRTHAIATPDLVTVR